MRRILIVLTSGLLVLTACSGTTVIEQVTTTGFGANEGAPATSVGGSQSAEGDVGTPASNEPVVRAAVLGLEEESAGVVATVAVDITHEVWCAGLGPGIRQAHQAAIDVRFIDPDGLADAVEELHRFYRASAVGRPLDIATHVASINTALDELEPVLRPVGWDYGLIDRSAITDADDAYVQAGMAIDRYNTDVCGLEPAGLPDNPEIEVQESVEQETPQPRDPDAPLSDADIAFMIGQAEATGMTREEATCFTDLYASGDDEDADLAQILLAISDCGLDPERLQELAALGDDGIQITSPDDPRTDEEVEAMIRSVERQGMTRAEAECHVDAYLGVVERGGDTDVALEKLLTCGLTVERMEELGIFAGCPWRPGMCANNN